MSVESYLTRQLDLRFIDARAISTEARISLGIEGYPAKDQLRELRNEAIRIFHSKPVAERRRLQELNMELEAIKTPSVCGSSDTDSYISSEQPSVGSSSSSSSGRGLRNIFRR